MNIIPPRWQLLTTGPAFRPGPSWRGSPRHRFWSRQANANGKSSCTRKNYIIQSGIKNDWRFLPKADEFCGPVAVTAAKSVLATALVKLLQILEQQLAGYRLLITECFKQHPDYHVFASLPGAGPKLAPRLLAELVALQPLADQPQVLQCLAGIAPVSYQSGRVSAVSTSPPMQPVPACNATLVGQIEPTLLRLGAYLLRGPQEKGAKPCVCAALPGNAWVHQRARCGSWSGSRSQCSDRRRSPTASNSCARSCVESIAR